MRFKISDTGIGIDPEYLPHIFDSFSQEDISTTNRHGGSGLGLAITRKLVNMMDGDITVNSEREKGSEFIVTLVLELADKQSDDTASKAETATPRGWRYKGRRTPFSAGDCCAKGRI